MIDTPTPTPLAPVTVEPLEPTTPIKPSEALRLGRLIRPEKWTGGYTTTSTNGCALMAIHEGYGGDGPLYETWVRLADFGITDHYEIGDMFDHAEKAGQDGDAAVLDFLESRGL